MLCSKQAGDDALDRKRAAHVLQQLVPPVLLRTPTWSAWLTLHSLLEEFGMHLIKPAWSQVGMCCCCCCCCTVLGILTLCPHMVQDN